MSDGIPMRRYQCQVCGHIYDPSKGEPTQGISAGTAFEDLPDEWVCPVCGSPKSMYAPM